jgi:hypothetical protein
MKSQQTLSDALEKRAKLIIQNQKPDDWNLSVPSLLEKEIWLTLEQLEQSKQQTTSLLQELLEEEALIDTEIMRLQPRHTGAFTTMSAPPHLMQRLNQITDERRNIQRANWDKANKLHSHLLELLQKHSHFNDE